MKGPTQRVRDSSLQAEALPSMTQQQAQLRVSRLAKNPPQPHERQSSAQAGGSGRIATQEELNVMVPFLRELREKVAAPRSDLMPRLESPTSNPSQRTTSET
jgi:hypothetical protein